MSRQQWPGFFSGALSCFVSCQRFAFLECAGGSQACSRHSIVLSFGFCKRSLQIVYKENISSFEDLLKRGKSFTIHQMNIQSLAIELFEVKGNLSNSIIYDIFQTRKMNSDLRAQTNFASNCVHTNKFSLNSRRYFAWNIVSLEIKNSGSVEIFKTKIRNWEPNDCYCYLRETYINNLGFVNVILIPFFIVKNCIYIYLKYFLIYQGVTF